MFWLCICASLFTSAWLWKRNLINSLSVILEYYSPSMRLSSLFSHHIWQEGFKIFCSYFWCFCYLTWEKNRVYNVTTNIYYHKNPDNIIISQLFSWLCFIGALISLWHTLCSLCLRVCYSHVVLISAINVALILFPERCCCFRIR